MVAFNNRIRTAGQAKQHAACLIKLIDQYYKQSVRYGDEDESSAACDARYRTQDCQEELHFLIEWYRNEFGKDLPDHIINADTW